jgi:hypothetical protein
MMQIPITTLRCVKNGTSLAELLAAIGGADCCGHCVITLGKRTCSLVVQNGVCMLAEMIPLRGEEALQALRRCGDLTVNVTIHNLTPAQLTRALEVNAVCRTVAALAEAVPGAANVTVIKPVGLRGGTNRAVKVKTVSHADTQNSPAPKAVHALGGQDSAAVRTSLQKKIGSGDINLERLSLDSIKGLKNSFRSDAASLLRELNLEHLIIEAKPGRDVKKTPNGEGKENGS